MSDMGTETTAEHSTPVPTPMGAVWLFVLLNVVVTSGLFFAWHTWEMSEQRTQHDAALAALRAEEAALFEYLATSTQVLGETSSL